MRDKKVITTANAPKAIGPYAQAILVDGWLYLSGQIALDPVSNNVKGERIGEQTRQVLNNLKAVIEAAGGTLADVVKTTVYLKDFNDFALMNEVYQQYFKTDPPARATVEVARLPKDVKVEIDAVARIT